MSLVITPETKIGELLEAYPDTENIITASTPAFAKLQNPVLRRTVMKSATLEQAAAMSGAPVRELVAKVREAAGVNGVHEPEGDAPEWVRAGRVTHSIDADAMLATGVHPVGEVRQVSAALGQGEILRLTSSFRPAPLIDMMRRNGMTVDCRESSPGRFTTDFCRLT